MREKRCWHHFPWSWSVRTFMTGYNPSSEAIEWGKGDISRISKWFVENHLAIFFLSVKWENSNTGQSLSHHLSKAFNMWCGLPMGSHGIPWLWGVKAIIFMFEGGNLLNMNLTPVTNIPWKLCNFSQVVWFSCRAIFANISQIYYFILEGMQHVCITHAQHVHMQLKFVLLKKKHCFCMVLVLSLHGWCNL